MKKYKFIMISLVIIQLTACSMSGGKKVPEVAKPGQSQVILNQDKDPQDSPVQAKETGNLSIWSFYDLGLDLQDLIQKRLPEVKIEYKVIPSFELTKTYTTAYNKGELPDVFMLDPILMGNFSSTNTFIDLAASPYDGESMLTGYPDNIKPSLHSLDGKKLLAMPVELIPAATTFRFIP